MGTQIVNVSTTTNNSYYQNNQINQHFFKNKYSQKTFAKKLKTYLIKKK